MDIYLANRFDGDDYLYYSTDEEQEDMMSVSWGNIAANPSAGKIIEAYEDDITGICLSNTNQIYCPLV